MTFFDVALFRHRLSPIGFALLAIACLSVSCGSQQEGQTAQAALPESQAAPVEVQGIKFQALAFNDPSLAAAAFGFDVRGAGLLPVRVSIDNHAGGALKIVPGQTFLIDLDGQAWPLLSMIQARNRLGSAGLAPHLSEVPALADLDASSGFALHFTTGGSFSAPDNRPNQDVFGKLSRNPKILAGQLALGAMLFPGRQESHGTRSLRLCYALDGLVKSVDLPLPAQRP